MKLWDLRVQGNKAERCLRLLVLGCAGLGHSSAIGIYSDYLYVSPVSSGTSRHLVGELQLRIQNPVAD